MYNISNYLLPTNTTSYITNTTSYISNYTTTYYVHTGGYIYVSMRRGNCCHHEGPSTSKSSCYCHKEIESSWSRFFYQLGRHTSPRGGRSAIVLTISMQKESILQRTIPLKQLQPFAQLQKCFRI